MWILYHLFFCFFHVSCFTTTSVSHAFFHSALRERLHSLDWQDIIDFSSFFSFIALISSKWLWTTFDSCRMCSDCNTFQSKENWFFFCFSLRVFMCYFNRQLIDEYIFTFDGIAVFSALVSVCSSAETSHKQQNTHKHQWTVKLFIQNKKNKNEKKSNARWWVRLRAALVSIVSEWKRILMTPTGRIEETHTEFLFFFIGILAAIKTQKSKCHSGDDLMIFGVCLFVFLFVQQFLFLLRKTIKTK